MKRAFFRIASLALILVALLASFIASAEVVSTGKQTPLTLDGSAFKVSPTPTHKVTPVALWAQAASPPPPQPGPKLYLAVGTFDPLLEPPPDILPYHLTMDTQPVGEKGYYIVQFTGPIHESDKAAVTALGAELFDYIPDFGFVVRMDAATADAVSTLGIVRWVGVYRPGFRLEPKLAADHVQSAISEPTELIVVVFKGEDVASIAGQLESMGGAVLETTETHWKGKIRVQIDATRLAEVASLPGVKWVEAAPVWRLSNDKAADIMGVRSVWQDHDIYGAGQIIGVCDTGLDQGSASPANLHDDFEDGSGNSRVVALYDLVGSGDGAEDGNSGHGTHVAGSILGNGDLSGAFPITHTFPSTSHVGMAPDAELVFQAVEDDAGYLVGIPGDLNTLFTQAYDDGARLHSNSWGSSVPFGSYSSYSQDVDEFVWDHPDFLPFFAASNDGIDANADGVIDLLSTTPPGTAKNCVTVGATENNRHGVSSATWGSAWPSDYPTDPIQSDNLADESWGMAAFSSRGPTLDGRSKPDVVAPGTFIASVRSSVATGTGWGAIDSNYMYMGGTSMSTPLTAGAAALAREFFVATQTYTPSAALIKATLVNGATDIYPGQYGTGTTQEITPTRPSQQAGWGRLNLEASLFPTGPRRTWYWDSPSVMTSSLNLLSSGETVTYTFEVTQTASLSVTLAWTDYPGSPAAGGGLVNDLDLRVQGPDDTYYPNHASQRESSQHLFYDDWGANAGYTWGAGVRLAVRFTPTSYPATVDKGLFLLEYLDTYPVIFNYYVYDDSGPAGRPGTELANGSTIIRRAGWHVVDLSGHNVTITSGDFYLAIELPDSYLIWYCDTGAPVDNRSWYNSGGPWSNWTSNDYMFQAVVRSADASTSYDRVNNLVGIDIPSPTTGVYTITVSGYNVPYGPQPYALVLSGVGRPLGTETVTRTIPSTGTYKFGNTGVTIEFSDESLDAVAVTVYRDQYPNASSTNVVKRHYRITPIGGSGTFTANVTFGYEQAEFEAATGSFVENEIVFYRWAGSTWTSYAASSRDTANNTVTLDGVTSFSPWALGGSGDPPTAVHLVSFTATPVNGAILLSWETATEIDALGFNLYRAESPGGPLTQLNDSPIPCQLPGSPVGATYLYLDETVVLDTVYDYWLEGLDIRGHATRHGPVSATVLSDAQHYIYLPLVIR